MPRGQYERKPRPWQERFWKYLTEGPLEDCWEWQGALNDKGYGIMYWQPPARSILAHRAAWLIEHDVIPDGLFVCHHCDNPACCNFKTHLFLGTAKDNTDDAVSKGRWPIRKSNLPGDHSKLSEQDVLLIRKLYVPGNTPTGERKGPLLRELAVQFGVSRDTIRNVVTRRTWYHI